MSQAISSTGTHSTDPLRSLGTLILLVRTLDQRLRTATATATVDLTITELGVLGQIERGADLPSLVARALRLDPARVTHIVDRLAAHSYVERAADPSDRRRWRLRLTAAGAARLAQGRADLRAVMEALLGGLPAEERAGLIACLEGVRRLLDAAAQGAEGTTEAAEEGARRAAPAAV
jgi:DNA-binding MarR family transcriptional regulator